MNPFSRTIDTSCKTSKLNTIRHQSRIARITAIICFSLFSALLGLSNTARAQDNTYLIPANVEWSYFASSQKVAPDWKDVGFEANNWSEGKSGFGYGDRDDTTLLSNMRGHYNKVYIRRSFTLNSTPKELYLYISFDDAFIAYVNGKEVARSHIKGKRKVSSHEASEIEVFKIKSKNLELGTNTLAIVGFNTSLDSSDFSLSPALSTSPNMLRVFSKERAIKDIRYLRERLQTQSSYLKLAPHKDPIRQLIAVEEKLPEHIGRQGLYRITAKAVGLLSDGHAKARLKNMIPPGEHYLPFGLVDAEGGVVAIDAFNKRIIDDQFKFVKSIDNIDIDTWVAASSRYTPNASPQLTRRRALKNLRDLNFYRIDVKQPLSNAVEITLADGNGKTLTKSFPLKGKRPRTPKIIKPKSQILEGNIGYLVIPKMDNDLIPQIHTIMQKYKHTDGLIIDVRDNGGGRYGIFRALAGYFYPDNAGPIVTNIAAYRLAPHFRKDHLYSRPTFPIDHSSWTQEEQAVIKTTMANFKPEWKLPVGEFSEWHVMLINRASERTSMHYHYDKPIVVLSNSSSFSATDGFLAGAHLFPNTTIMGQASGGGSGRTQRFALPESGINISLSSMASFRVNGKTFDGNGVEVDVEILPQPTDFIRKSDKVLKEALTYITEETIPK